LRRFTGGAEEVSAGGATIAAVVEDLEHHHPGLKERLCDEAGKVRRFVNIFVNGDDIRFLDNLETTIKDGDEVSIVPAIAGGEAYRCYNLGRGGPLAAASCPVGSAFGWEYPLFELTKITGLSPHVQVFAKLEDLIRADRSRSYRPQNDRRTAGT
jgi:molybdopterin synthase sulfur carrier subunit